MVFLNHRYTYRLLVVVAYSILGYGVLLNPNLKNLEYVIIFTVGFNVIVFGFKLFVDDFCGNWWMGVWSGILLNVFVLICVIPIIVQHSHSLQ